MLMGTKIRMVLPFRHLFPTSHKESRTVKRFEYSETQLFMRVLINSAEPIVAGRPATMESFDEVRVRVSISKRAHVS
jgi:hypothetical protein